MHSAGFNKVFTVLIGPKSYDEAFTIHEDVLRSTSKFFQSACSKALAEKIERGSRLPEVQPNLFQMYTVWVYSGKVVINEKKYSFPVSQLELLLHAWLLGDVLGDAQFRNQVMRTCVEKLPTFDIVPNVDIFTHVWKKTTPRSPLRKMLVDVIVARFERTAFIKRVKDYPREVLEVVAVSLMLHQDPIAWNTFANRVSEYLEPESGGTSG